MAENTRIAISKLAACQGFYGNLTTPSLKVGAFVATGSITFPSGALDLGDGTAAGDFDGAIVEFIFGTQDVTIAVTHGLGHAPVGYFPVHKSEACYVYKATNVSTTTLKLQCNTAGVTMNIFVF